METFIIERSGPLHGTVEVNGAKNAALPILAACLLTDDESVIEHVPRVTDVVTMTKILEVLGVDVEWDEHRVAIRPGKFSGWTAPYELVNLMRASICVLGPLLARQGRARVSMPGGCVIGPRPIDLHLKGLEQLGASIVVDHGDIMARAERLRGATMHLAGAFGSSVLATANVMMAATLADGDTLIEQAAREPEVVDLANFLIAMGAKISGQGSSVIRVEGVPRLHGARHRVIADRVEAGTLMMAVAITCGDATIKGIAREHLGAVWEKLHEAGVLLESLDGSTRVCATHRLKSVDVTTLPFPGFPTDLQAQMTTLMSSADGVSVISERIYPERFMHVAELIRMGAQIARDGATAVIKGVERLSGAPVAGSDLRGAAALILAGLAADNHTELRGIEHLDRGYEGFEHKLTRLGAKIRREQR